MIDPSAEDPGSQRRKLFSSGSLLIVGFGVFLVAGWFLYLPYIPPAWLHDLGADIALRAAADPDAPLPRDTREASPRGLADSPYICVAKVVRQSWDRVVIVAAGQDPRGVAALNEAKWPTKGLDDWAAEMVKDQRYQLIVLLKGDSVIDAQVYYTFWGDLGAIARPEGYTPEQAVFTAASKDGLYVVTPAADVPPDVCK